MKMKAELGRGIVSNILSEDAKLSFLLVIYLTPPRPFFSFSFFVVVLDNLLC